MLQLYKLEPQYPNDDNTTPAGPVHDLKAVHSRVSGAQSQRPFEIQTSNPEKLLHLTVQILRSDKVNYLVYGGIFQGIGTVILR